MSRFVEEIPYLEDSEFAMLGKRTLPLNCFSQKSAKEVNENLPIYWADKILRRLPKIEMATHESHHEPGFILFDCHWST